MPQIPLIPNCIICDLDGTLASVEWRRHLAKKQDWTDFFSGIPFDPVVPWVKCVVNFTHVDEVIFVSGRPDKYRKETLDWMNKNNVRNGPLFMRPTHDGRSDDVIKEEILVKEILNKYTVKLILDDSPTVIKMWKKHNLNVYPVIDPCLEPPIFTGLKFMKRDNEKEI